VSDSSGINDATAIVDEVLNRLGPPPSDPTETWRAALGQSTSAQLRQTQAALAASQADLTRMEAELHDALRRAADLEQVREELRIARFGNERDLADIQDLTSERDALVKALATANHQNRLLTAELGSALRRLNDKEGKS
jgi:predicted  nucleic acid-binding Zn-ribbon protein